MLDYLEKYNNLPQEFRDKMSSPEIISVIEDLEKKYGLSLAAIIMRVIVGDISIGDLKNYLTANFQLNEANSERLAGELNEKVFSIIRISALPQQDARISKGLMARSPSFLFSRDEEREINELAKKINGIAHPLSQSEQVDERLDNIVKKLKIDFGSEFLATRFRNILKTYLTGIRDKIDTKQALCKPFELGGLEFDEQSASDVILVADGESDSLRKSIVVEPPKRIRVIEDELKNMEAKPGPASKMSDKSKREYQRAGIRDIEYDLSSLKKISQARKLDFKHELAPLTPAIKKEDLFKEPLLDSSDDIKRGEQKVREKAEQKEKEIYSKIKPQIRIPTTAQGKVRMEDVRFQPKVMGPVDELRYMDLVNFRRLDKDPAKAAEKIKEKIGLLSEEYSKKIEGIKAWRISPVNKLYLEIGHASISERKPVDIIAEERKTGGREYLNNDEFAAIIDLNKHLRF